MTKSYNSPFEHVDYNAIIDGTKGNGVLSGLDVTERAAGQNMSVDVASGVALINKLSYTEASTVNVVISAADATYPRKDIIIYDVATTNPAVVTGTPAAEPIPPDITSDDILLAIVNVAANETTIANTDIEDGRVWVSHVEPHHATHEVGGSDPILYGLLLVPSSDIFHANNAEKTANSLTYIKIKECVISGGVPDTLRIYYDMKSGTGGTLGSSNIYRNGVAVGTQRDTTTATYASYTEDISGWSDGDLLQIYALTDLLGYPCYVRNLRVLGYLPGSISILGKDTVSLTNQDP